MDEPRAMVTEAQRKQAEIQRSLEELTNLIQAMVAANTPVVPAPHPQPATQEEEAEWYARYGGNPQAEGVAGRPAAIQNPPPAAANVQNVDGRRAVLEDKLEKLERDFERLKEPGVSGLDMESFLLFPEVKLPDKFKFPDLPKFNGVGDPNAHLMSYVGTLVPMGLCSKLLAQSFHRTLTNDALKWFMELSPSKKKSWEEIGVNFVNQFSYTIEMQVTTRELETTRMDVNESFADFVGRWRAKAAKMTDRPTEKEQIRMVVKNLQPVFAKYMMIQNIPTFDDLYEVGFSIEEAITEEAQQEQKEWQPALLF